MGTHLRIATVAILSVLSFALVLSAANGPTENWNGYGDSTKIVNFNGSGDTSLKYSEGFKLSAYENMRVNVFFKDTTAAGVANDSVAAEWGFRTYNFGPGGIADTVFTGRVRVDTCNTTIAASFVKQTVRDADSLVAYGCPWGTIDSLNTGRSGWSKQSMPICPYWDLYIQFWVRGLASNKNSKKLVWIFQPIRRLGLRVAPE